MKIKLYLLIWPVLTLLWCLGLGLSWGVMPAMAPLLDLHSGIWSHHSFEWQSHVLKGLQKDVQVAIDAAGVPHIFAQNESDLYFAQGYIMASQRLFQMDLSSRSTSGHLSELVGARGLEIDRFYVRFGMRQSVLKTVNDYMSNPQTALMINSFVNGINLYIRQLKDLPIEYKLLGQTPAAFNASRVIQMAKTLTFALSGRNAGYILSHLQQQLGSEKVLDLFPEFPPLQPTDYVLQKVWGPVKRQPESPRQFSFVSHFKNFPNIPQPAKGNGSNNWVVGPSRSKTGHSILANDTHLGLTLPNIWFENQLSCPAFNVYGVSLVDVPGLINGFTATTAWGPTNGSTQALDYYEVEFADGESLSYLDHGLLRTAQVFHETIALAGLPEEMVDVTWTKWGPVLYREGRYALVANWTGYESGRELLALRKLYDSHDLKGCMQAFHDWHVPIQNFVCADPDHIGLVHAGYIPKRTVGEGRFVEPPTELALRQPIPEEARPLVIDPSEGFLRSANERVEGPTYPYYLGWDYEEPYRGRQIGKLLRAQEKFSGADLIAIQNDDFDPQAEDMLPIMLKAVDRAGLSEEQKLWLKKLEAWDLHDLYDRAEPVLYKAWYRQLKHDIFADEYLLPEAKNFLPRDVRVAELLKDVFKNPAASDAQWVDDKKTQEKETLPQLLQQSFRQAWIQLIKDFGRPERWQWKTYNPTRIPHVAKIPGFGSDLLEMSGAAESVRGNAGWHGAVYKLVVELGAWPNAWIQVPGGTSGDPLSKDFERNVVAWSRGVMRKVEFFRNLKEAQSSGAQIVQLQAGEF